MNIDTKTLSELKRLANGMGISEKLKDTPHYWRASFVTNNPVCLKLRELAISLSELQDSVLITGESGTGKEIIAHILHGTRKGRFVPVNVTALPDQLIESELFGHVRGSFTGCVGDKPGLVEAANLGTLFLDEVGDMPMAAQVKMLRFLQDGEFRHLGSNDITRSSCRVVMATNKNIDELIGKEKFREDLYWRLTHHLHIPPLRERPEDIEEILLSILELSEFPPDFKMPQESIFRGNVRFLQRYVARYKSGCYTD